MQALQASEGQVEELRDHVIIAGFGRVGQIIATLLAERLIPFVAIDVRVDRVQVWMTCYQYVIWRCFFFFDTFPFPLLDSTFNICD